MMRKSFPACLVVLLFLAGASRSEAILRCEDCSCSIACTHTCYTDTDSSTCGATGYCSGGFNCGGTVCLTASQSQFILGLLDRTPQKNMSASPERGRAVARLTWKLAEFAEENGLGEVYAGEASGLSAKVLGKPALSFVSREHLVANRTTPGTPDLVVELASVQTANVVASWLRHGTRAALVIDPKAETVTLYRSGAASRVLEAGTLLELPDLLPGWSLPISDLFR